MAAMTTTNPPAAGPATRRERLRLALIADIKECACRQLAEGGPAAVTLRGIAREIGVSPAALYGYFDSLDALFTALITDGYDDLADAVAAAVAVPPADEPGARMLAGVRAFREWALAQPATFRLLYFSPVPGYEAPVDGPTMTASLRVFVPLLALMVDAWVSGVLPPPPPGPAVDVTKFHERFGLTIASDQLRMATECWAEFHGLVALEINGHIHADWVDPAALYEANMQSLLLRLGFAL
jgi:AcrR family transcriptional regulator